MNLQLFKGKAVGAKKGFDLLKSKADALKVGYSSSGIVYCRHLSDPYLRLGSEKFVRIFTTQKWAWLIPHQSHFSV